MKKKYLASLALICALAVGSTFTSNSSGSTLVQLTDDRLALVTGMDPQCGKCYTENTAGMCEVSGLTECEFTEYDTGMETNDSIPGHWARCTDPGAACEAKTAGPWKHDSLGTGADEASAEMHSDGYCFKYKDGKCYGNFACSCDEDSTATEQVGGSRDYGTGTKCP